jgi:hypothetical protein
MNKHFISGFLVIVFLGALLTYVYWPLLIVAGIIGGYLIQDTKKALSAFVAGILSYCILFLRFIFSGYFGKVTTFINSVAGVPALPLTLIIGGVLALLGALIGVSLYKIYKK